MRIDVHAHYFANEYIDVLSRAADEGSGGSSGALRGRYSLDEQADMMAAVGIDLQVLSVGPAQPYLPRAADAREAARLANDIYAEACRGHGGRFAAFGTVPLPHVDEALAEVERCLDSLGMRGVTIGCSVAGRPLDDPHFEPFYAELDRRGALLFLHPVGVGAGAHTEAYDLTWMVGAPFEDTVAALRLVLSGLTTRYPRLRVIVPHLGGTLPFLLQRLDDQAERSRATDPDALPMEGQPSAAVRRLWFDTVNLHPPALRCACESFGADRLLLGTDFPFLLGPKLERCVTYVQQAGLAADEVRAVLEGNAEALLGLGLRSAPSNSAE